MNKSDFRMFAKKKKTDIDFPFVSDAVCKKIIKINEYKTAKNVLLYSALSDEISLDILIKDLMDRGATCIFPVVCGENLILKEFDGNTVEGKFGIREPVGNVIPPSEVEFAVIPGVMFDNFKNRLGRGKGFYDRLLPELDCLTVGVCPDELLIERLPEEKHDVSVHMVITDKRVV